MLAQRASDHRDAGLPFVPPWYIMAPINIAA